MGGQFPGTNMTQINPAEVPNQSSPAVVDLSQQHISHQQQNTETHGGNISQPQPNMQPQMQSSLQQQQHLAPTTITTNAQPSLPIVHANSAPASDVSSSQGSHTPTSKPEDTGIVSASDETER